MFPHHDNSARWGSELFFPLKITLNFKRIENSVRFTVGLIWGNVAIGKLSDVIMLIQMIDLLKIRSKRTVPNVRKDVGLSNL
jgi:hypothetical protein